MAFTSGIVGSAASRILLIAYQGYLRCCLRKDPGYTVQRVNNLAGTAWMEEIMRRREGVLAVQTPRNSCSPERWAW